MMTGIVSLAPDDMLVGGCDQAQINMGQLILQQICFRAGVDDRSKKFVDEFNVVLMEYIRIHTKDLLNHSGRYPFAEEIPGEKNVSYLDEVEKGAVEFGPEVLWAVARILGCEVELLFEVGGGKSYEAGSINNKVSGKYN